MNLLFTLPSISFAEGSYNGAYGDLKAGLGNIHSSGSTLLGSFDIRTSSGIFGVLLAARTKLNNGPIYEFELDGNYYSDRHIQLLKILTT